jgi:SMODS and SLOG-associating 2TM effector domain 1
MPDLQNDSSSSNTSFLAQLRTRPVSKDDMDDSAEIDYYKEAIAAGKPSWKPLMDALQLFQRIVAPAFNEEDQLALKFQSRYMLVSVGAVGMGAVTVCLAIIQLAAHLHSADAVEKTAASAYYWQKGLEVGEIAAAALTFLIVVIAIAIRPKEKWLTCRFKAEALRVFKFNMLCDPRLWTGHASDRSHLESELRTEISEMRRKTLRDAEDWATQGTIPSVNNVSLSAKCGDAQEEFVHYYRAKRLEAQMSYLELKALQREEQGTVWSLVLQVLFWGSLAFVLGHAGLSLAGGKEVVSNTFIALAAGLPVIAGAVRTYKSSREFERNAARHEATLFTLEKLATRLDSSHTCEESYATIGFCEQVLEADSREWMRLMVSAEWYG